jgi:hypothetical protein
MKFILGVIALVLTAAGGVAAVRPHPVTNPVLGAEWQCSHTLFVLTCTHPTSHTSGTWSSNAAAPSILRA